MDNNNNFIITSAQSCLHSFSPATDASKQLQFQLSNSPSTLKLAEAGFERTPESKTPAGISDEVQCKTCGIKYSRWSGERPLAVHRTLSPNCFFLNTPPSSNKNREISTTHSQENLRNDLRNVRRQLFPSYDTLASMLEDYPDIQNPFVPKRGDFLMLFESFRLLTFQVLNLNQDTTFSRELAVFAKCGFMYDSNSLNAACVFCGQEVQIRPMNLFELEILHEQASANCPFVKDYDVGNVSCEEERRIKEKVQRELHSKRLSESSDIEYLIRHPEYESIESRLGTFSTWPPLLAAIFSEAIMAECGFYYTGIKDSVVCYCCGIGLCNWDKGADPYSQHARASPDCLHIQKLKSQEYIAIAQRVQLTVQVEYSPADISDDSYSSEGSDSDSDSSMVTTSSSTSSSSSSSTSPLSQVGSPTLDLEAIKAATCQYTIQKISNAIRNFFVRSNGRYPNKDLLLGTLRAEDLNYNQLCQKTQEIILKDREKSCCERQLKATKRELARAKDINEWKDVTLRSEIRHKDEMLEQKDGIIEQKDGIIEQNREMLEQKDVMLELKEREVADLRRHIQSLLASQFQFSGTPTTEVESDTTEVEEEFPIASCKVCLSSKAQVVFLPCKHLCCCDACAARLYGQNCPICREPNRALEKVYVI